MYDVQKMFTAFYFSFRIPWWKDDVDRLWRTALANLWQIRKSRDQVYICLGIGRKVECFVFCVKLNNCLLFTPQFFQLPFNFLYLNNEKEGKHLNKIMIMMGKAFLHKGPRGQLLNINHCKMFREHQSVLGRDVNRNKEQNSVFEHEEYFLNQVQGWNCWSFQPPFPCRYLFMHTVYVVRLCMNKIKIKKGWIMWSNGSSE